MDGGFNGESERKELDFEKGERERDEVTLVGAMRREGCMCLSWLMVPMIEVFLKFEKKMW